MPGQFFLSEIQISIHALREEGDGYHLRFRRFHRYFYPRPPRGGRLRFVDRPGGVPGISIHALREEGDEPVFMEAAPC